MFFLSSNNIFHCRLYSLPPNDAFLLDIGSGLKGYWLSMYAGSFMHSLKSLMTPLFNDIYKGLFLKNWIK